MAGFDEVPTLDFGDYTNGTPEQRLEFICTVGGSLERFGFVCFENHGVDTDLLESAYAAAKRAFELADSVKRGYEVPETGRQRGYTSFGVEHAKDQPTPDMKEFWQVGRDLGEGHPLHASGKVPTNVFPDEVPEFAEIMLFWFQEMEHFSNLVLDVVGAYLNLPDGYFRKMVEQSNSVVRVIHYPAIGDANPDGAVRAAKHEDINLMTILPASTHSGLQLLTHDGRWMDVTTKPGVLVCDTGDMMNLITGGQLPATTHRVVNPVGSDRSQPRYSMPFFQHPHPDFMLSPILDSDSDEEPIRADDFLRQRLAAIGVM
jgi:isopenicillin N synthase-like dioxygenase